MVQSSARYLHPPYLSLSLSLSLSLVACCLLRMAGRGRPQVFWWLVEGKFGRREEALAPRLFDMVVEGAEDNCSNGTNEEQQHCEEASWSMITPGWALILGITAVSRVESSQSVLSVFASFNPRGGKREIAPKVRCSTRLEYLV